MFFFSLFWAQSMGCCLERIHEQPSTPELRLTYLDGEPNPADQYLRNANDIANAMWNEGYSEADSEDDPMLDFDQEGAHHTQINGGHKRLYEVI